jgi:hypothetical protein
VTYPEFVDIATRRLKLVNFGLPFEITTMDTSMGMFRVCVSLHVKHRDTGEPIIIRTFRDYAADMSELHVVHRLFDQIKDMLIHELMECTMLDGVRLYDPHAGTTLQFHLAKGA